MLILKKRTIETFLNDSLTIKLINSFTKKKLEHISNVIKMLSHSDQTEVDENTKDILYLNEQQSTQNT